MSTTPATPPPPPLVGLHDSQAGDLRVGDVTGGDKTVYTGVASEQVIDLLARHLDKEPQYRAAQATMLERGQRSTDAKLDRIAGILGRLTTALAVEAVVLFLLLLVMIQVLVVLVSPRLIAGV